MGNKKSTSAHISVEAQSPVQINDKGYSSVCSNIENSPQYLILASSEIGEAVFKPQRLSLVSQLPLSKKNRSINRWNPSSTNSEPFETEINQPFCHYRFKMESIAGNPSTCNKPPDDYFLAAIYYPRNIALEYLRIQFLHEISILAKDPSVIHDIRDCNGSKLAIYDFDSSNDFSNNKKQEKVKNSALIHDLIDANKNLMDHKIWIPAIFNCIENRIQSQILNLDIIQYSNLYSIIGDIFFHPTVKQSFELLLNRKLSAHEKVIVKCMTYELNENNAKYVGNVHREGMGENITAVALFYPSISKNIEDGDLEIIIVVNDNVGYGYWYDNSNQKKYQFKIREGSMVVFSNDCFHRLVSLQYPKECGKEKSEHLSRTVLAFFLVSCNAINIPASDDNRLNERVNLFYICKYIVNHWWNESESKHLIDKEWMVDVIRDFVCGDSEYIYDKRDEMRYEKGRAVSSPKKQRPRLLFGGAEGGTPY